MFLKSLFYKFSRYHPVVRNHLVYRSFASKALYICKECQKESLKWQGKCSGCNSRNSIIEKVEIKQQQQRKSWINDEGKYVSALDSISSENEKISFPDVEFNRIFGGGLVLGSVILISGAPGIGKSTFALQLSAMIATGLNKNVLYVSGEESIDQIGLRTKRLLSIKGFDKVDIMNEPNMNNVLNMFDSDDDQQLHGALIVDSIQTMYLDSVQSESGGVVQVKECTLAAVRMAKAMNIPIILIGHITKSGDVAGPQTLSHLVDVVLFFEGDEVGEHRWLTCSKNRFGPTDVGVFELTDNGFVSLQENTRLFVSKSTENKVSDGVAWTMSGVNSQASRFVLVEVQALTNQIFRNNPRPRKTKTSGIHLDRIDWLSAVISKHVPHQKELANSDIFINVVGGLFINDRGSDLGLAVAMISSVLKRPVKWPSKGKRSGIAFVGEVGLSGDIRPAGKTMNARISAANKVGLAQLVVSKSWLNENESKIPRDECELIGVDSLEEIVNHFLA